MEGAVKCILNKAIELRKMILANEEAGYGLVCSLDIGHPRPVADRKAHLV
jgi:hypothetical protein